jgi:hypothetical protein
VADSNGGLLNNPKSDARLFRRSGADERRHNAQLLSRRVSLTGSNIKSSMLLYSFRPEKTMSTARIIPAPRVATTWWIVIALLGAAIIAYAVYAALDGNIASSDLLVGP